MDSNGYDVVFDIARQPFSGWFVGVFGSIFVLIGVGLTLGGENLRTKVFGALFILISAVVSVAAVWSLWAEYDRYQSVYRNGQYFVVEGRVRDFVEAPVGDHGPQTFVVSGHRFEIWQAEHTSAFHETTRAGGPHLAGRCIRAAFTEENEIIWLGVRRLGCTPTPPVPRQNAMSDDVERAPRR